MNHNYTAETIQSLDFIDHIRKYVGMYIGSKTIDGLHHCVKEIVSNGIDEYLNGSGSKMVVRLQKDGGVFVSDDGRGIPLGKNEDGESLLFACFGKQNTGGKFNNDGLSGYNTSGGLHGTGAKAVNALSKRMVVTSTRDGQREVVEFEQGIMKKQYVEKGEGHGVTVLFYPDPEVLEAVVPDGKAIKKMIQEFSFLCKGLVFEFEDEREGVKETFLSNNGLYDYFEYLNLGKTLLTQPFYFEESEGQFQVEVAFGYNTSYSSIVKLYTNNIPQEKGTHLTGFKTAFTSTLNTFAKERGWLKEKDSNLTGSDFEEGQVLILNFKMIDPVFKGQHKDELSSSEGRTYVQKFATAGLKEVFARNEKEIKKIVDKALSARKARESAKKARDKAREINVKGTKAKAIDLPSKLVDATSKKRGECELFICEGDSAASGIIDSRDAKTQAVLPVRGKVISALKNSDEKILANAEVQSIIKALGLKLDANKLTLEYDTKSLRYTRVLMATDADEDGSAIQMLLLTLFWSLCPELILNGHLFVTVPPLFVVKTNKDEYIYLKGHEELEDWKTKNPTVKFELERVKGLGQMNSNELGECIVDYNTRQVKQIVVEERAKANEIFEIMMGTKVTPRRDYLLKELAKGE